MADINQLNITFVDGSTVINAERMNAIVGKINELVTAVNNGSTPAQQTVATPVINISGNTATITCATSGATIKYTTDGSTPSASNGNTYSSAITLNASCTIKAVAIKSGMTNSSVASQSYTPSVVATPAISISGTSATITCSTSGATIHYTLDGTTPTASSTQYSSPITLSGACTIKAIAVKSGMTNSSVASQPYTPTVNIEFADSAVEALCVANFDTNNDGHISEAEAAAVTSIPMSIFKDNTAITSFEELRYFTGASLAQKAFSGCSNLGRIQMADNQNLPTEVFKSCENLELSSLPANVSAIGSSAFYYCSKITANVIPASVTSIGTFAFYMCKLLEHIKCLPTTPPNLGNKNAFGVKNYGNTLADVYVPDASYDAYKVASAWSDLFDAGKLHKLSEYPVA